jgi:hypothetical protein
MPEPIVADPIASTRSFTRIPSRAFSANASANRLPTWPSQKICCSMVIDYVRSVEIGPEGRYDVGRFSDFRLDTIHARAIMRLAINAYRRKDGGSHERHNLNCIIDSHNFLLGTTTHLQAGSHLIVCNCLHLPAPGIE